MAADFAGTTKILSNPGAADPGMVASNIDAWKTSLAGLGSAGQSIIGDLDALKMQLTSSSPDGAAIGKLMAKLGHATTQSGPGNAELQELGKHLTALGS